MRYVAAYLLAVLGGNKNPSASDIKDILSSVGIDVDSERLDVVIKELNGKDIAEVGLFSLVIRWILFTNTGQYAGTSGKTTGFPCLIVPIIS